MDLRKLIKASSSALSAFQQDVSLVIAGIRLAYLIDVFTLQPCQLATLQQLLNRNDPSRSRIFFFHESDSEQTFAINAELLTRIFSKNGRSQSKNPVVYIDVASGEAQSGHARSTEQIMQSLHQTAISCLSSQNEYTLQTNCIISLSDHMAISAEETPALSSADNSGFMTMLAGILLEYPFVYASSESPPVTRSMHQLDGKVLVLVKLLLISGTTKPAQTVIQFSVPLKFKESNEELFNQALLERKKMYQDRIHQLQQDNPTQTEISQLVWEVKTVLLDQVAL